jgi:Domain of unknown function (DUF4337)
MEIREHAAQVRELVDEDAEDDVVLEGAAAPEDEASGRHAAATRRRLRTTTALTVGGLAVLLAVASLKGDETTLHAGVADRGANENWTQYQAKRTRQLAHEIDITSMERELFVLGTAAGPDVRQRFAADIEHAQAEIQRLEDEPDPQHPTDPALGDGKTQIARRALALERERADALARIPNFHYAETLLQVALVLSSVAIVRASQRWLLAAIACGGAATLLLANGLFFLFPMFGGH